MKNKLFTAIFLTVLSLAFMTAGAAAKTDFNGTWKLDAAKSKGPQNECGFAAGKTSYETHFCQSLVTPKKRKP